MLLLAEAACVVASPRVREAVGPVRRRLDPMCTWRLASSLRDSITMGADPEFLSAIASALPTCAETYEERGMRPSPWRKDG
jgi:hypothetical protein